MKPLTPMAAYCFNPGCLTPDNANADILCRSCSASLQLQERYQAVRLLGQGGFGRTFLAIDSAQTPFPCVIKQFWSQSSNLESDRAKAFYLEVQRLGELKHPQIPVLLDSFQQEGHFYLVQEYIAGENLATVLATNGRFSAAEVWQILEGLLPVVQFIHEWGVVHRDIKPENIVCRFRLNSLLKQGDFTDLVLVDFGAAKLVTPMTLMQLGTTIGSPEYAAPEQVKGRAVFASDLYSLGVTCIHLLTGVRSFDLFDFANDAWVWRDYWLPDPLNSAKDRSNQLAQILDRLIEPALKQRFTSAEAAIAFSQKLRGKKIRAMPAAPTWKCYLTLSGHSGLFASVNAVAIAPDHKLLASASDDKTVRIWDLQTGKEVALRGHTKFVKAVAFHPQTQILASGSCDRTIKLWDVQQLQEIRLLSHQHHVNALAFSSDGHILASGSSDKTVKLWHPDGEPIVTLVGHTLAVNAIAFSPVAPVLASASSDSRIKIWDLSKFELLQTLTGHTSAVRAIAFSPDGQLLATTGEDRTIRLWDVTSWQCLRILPGHSWAVSALTFSPDGASLLSGSWDKTVKLWQTSTGSEIAMLVDHTDSVNCVVMASDGSVIASGSKDRTVKLWRTSS